MLSHRFAQISANKNWENVSLKHCHKKLEASHDDGKKEWQSAKNYPERNDETSDDFEQYVSGNNVSEETNGERDWAN